MVTEYSLRDKYNLIKQKALEQTSKNPIIIVKSIMHEDFINMHGPEHHFLDGVAFLVAYHNAGGLFDLEAAIDVLAQRTVMMPGAICGYWGVCGSTTSVGAALAVIHDTGPLTNNDYYKDNMEYTSGILKQMSKIGGPRCCKRNAFLSISEGVRFVNRKYGIPLELEEFKCEFYPRNAQCIGKRCPFFPFNK